MARASIRVGLGHRGASLAVVARELRRMDGQQVKGIFRRRLEDAARPYPALVRASILAIPVKPGGKHTGLRARIAQCVELSSGTDARSAYVSVWVNPFKMLPDYVTLPLYMEGVKLTSRGGNYSRWRHPVYGTPAEEEAASGHGRGWVWRDQASHPYFYQAATPLGRAAGPAIDSALGDITRKING
jgi:hypothetical protein